MPLLAQPGFGPPESFAAQVLSLAAIVPAVVAAVRFGRKRKLRLLAAFAAAVAVDALHHACVFGLDNLVSDFGDCTAVHGLEVAVASMLPIAFSATYVMKAREDLLTVSPPSDAVIIAAQPITPPGQNHLGDRLMQTTRCWLVPVLLGHL